MKNYPPEILWEKLQLYIEGQLPANEKNELEALIREDQEVREMLHYFKYLEEDQEHVISQTNIKPKTSSLDRHLQYVTQNYQRLSVLFAVDHILKYYSIENIPAFQLAGVKWWQKLINFFEDKWDALISALNKKVLISVFSFTVLAVVVGVNKEMLFPYTGFTPEQESLMTQFGDYQYAFGGGENSSTLDKAMEKYYTDQKDYNNAERSIARYLNQYDNLKNEEPKYYGAIRFYQAICLIHQNDLQTAVAILEELNEMQANTETQISSIDQELIPFYLGFAYQLNGEPIKASGFLESVRDSNIQLPIQNGETATVKEIVNSLLGN